MTEENENKEGYNGINAGQPDPKELQLDEEPFKTEEHDLHNVLYEEQDAEDDLCSGGGHTTAKIGKEISVEKLMQPMVKSYL